MSEKVSICGFLIVRVPGNDFDFENRGVLYDSSPFLNGAYYAGVDRMPWWDLEELYYQRALDIDLSVHYSELRKDDDDLTGLVVGKDINFIRALKMLNHDIDTMNEIIAVVSPKLGRIKGYTDIDPKQIRWLGYDAVSLGNWSLVRDGIFRNTYHFPEFVEVINSNGLFDMVQTAEEFIPAYMERSHRGDLGEVLPGSLHGVDIVQVGRFIDVIDE